MTRGGWIEETEGLEGRQSKSRLVVRHASMGCAHKSS